MIFTIGLMATCLLLGLTARSVRILLECFLVIFTNTSSEANNTSDVAVWNIETEEHKHLARHATASHTGACVDMRYCLTASRKENMLRIWNLSSKVII